MVSQVDSTARTQQVCHAQKSLSPAKQLISAIALIAMGATAVAAENVANSTTGAQPTSGGWSWTTLAGLGIVGTVAYKCVFGNN